MSRSSSCHITNIILRSAAAATACCIGEGHVAQGPRLVSGHGPFRGTAFFVKPQENYHKARARMLQNKGIRVPGSMEAIYFRRFYRFPCVGFLPSVGNVGWFTTTCLKIAEQRFFYICASFRMRELYRDKSNNALSSDRYHSYRYSSVLSRFSLILSLVSR